MVGGVKRLPAARTLFHTYTHCTDRVCQPSMLSPPFLYIIHVCMYVSISLYNSCIDVLSMYVCMYVSVDSRTYQISSCVASGRLLLSLSLYCNLLSHGPNANSVIEDVNISFFLSLSLSLLLDGNETKPSTNSFSYIEYVTP